MHGTVARLDQIVARAAKLNLKLGRLCKLAEVEQSTVSRWRNGRTDPKESTTTSHLGRLERKLDELEEDIVKSLGQRPEARVRQRPAA